MYVQSSTTSNINSPQLPYSKPKKREENYYAFMSRHSEDIIQTSVIAGTLTGAFAARKNINDELVPKVFKNIGFSTLGLFGLASAIFNIPTQESSDKK